MEEDTRVHLENGPQLDGDRFEILNAIGGGGFGLTYQAIDRSFDRVVALKEYYPFGGAERRAGGLVFLDSAPDVTRPEIVAASEALNAGRIDHPAVAKTIKTFAERGTAYIAMEWIDGRTLRSTKAPEQSVVRRVYLTVLDVVLHLSKAGIAHRDLNPNNIMIREDGEPIVIDFGLARAVGPGFTWITRTVAFMAGFEAPEQRDSHGHQDVWTDIYTLSASIFFVVVGHARHRTRQRELRDLALASDRRVAGFDPRFLECIDRGLIHDPGARLKSGAEALEILGMSTYDLKGVLSPAVFERTLLAEKAAPAPVRGAPPKQKETQYQRCLLQSFDTARFQPSAVRRIDGSALTVDAPAKVALARTEAALNVVFGREIVVPAGQIAESEAFFVVFGEMMAPYTEELRTKIAAACKNAHLPAYRPMRLALERRRMGDYVGFLQEYRFTGAPLRIIESAGHSQDDQLRKAALLRGFKDLFLAAQYDKLEAAVKRAGYGSFAKTVRDYFNADTAIFANTAIPEVSANDYRQVFEHRLRDRGVSGAGVEEARDKLPLVEQIERELQQDDASGYRGNWYLFAERFEGVWPLARAYLDLRLFLTLARQYEVDHPILISQEFEYGRFDHSLLFGPKFAANMTESNDGALLEMSSHFAEPIDWGAIFNLYLEPKFLRSVQRMNQYFFSTTPGHEQHYVDEIIAHGDKVNELLKGIFKFTTVGDRLSVSPADAPPGPSLRHDWYDPTGLTPEARERDRAAADSMLSSFGGLPQEHVSVSTLLSDPSGKRAGAAAANAILNYFAKPYRLLAASRE